MLYVWFVIYETNKFLFTTLLMCSFTEFDILSLKITIGR